MQPHGRTALRLGAVAVLMFGFGFALVPLYEVMCKALGISRENVRTQAVAAPVKAATDIGRTVRMQFLANNDGTMPWQFHPQTFELKVNPGAVNNTTFFVQNTTSRPMVAQAIASVAPLEAAQYLHKMECFCFRQQPLAAGAGADLPLQFVVDQALPAHIRTITLSYTLFDVTDRAASASTASATPTTHTTSPAAAG